MKLIEPMLATLVPEAFDRPGWVYEEKYDGIRAVAYRTGKPGPSRLAQPQGHHGRSSTSLPVPWEAVPGGDFVLDGESSRSIPATSRASSFCSVAPSGEAHRACIRGVRLSRAR